MARMQGNTVSIGGNPAYFFIDWGIAGQNEDGNYTAINWAAYFHFQNNDAQLDNGVANLAGGTRWANGGRVYNFANNFSTRDLGLASGSFNVGHDGNGNLGINVNGGITPYQTARSQGSQDFGIPSLYQAIAFNDIQIINVTDVSFQVYCNVNRWANLLQLNVDGQGWVTYYNGGYGTVTVQVGSADNPISSGQQHSVQLRTRRNSNGWITDSGVYYPTTLDQGKFFDMEL